MKSKELLLKHLTLNDCTGYVTSDGRLYKAIIDALDEAIDYAHSSQLLNACFEIGDKVIYDGEKAEIVFIDKNTDLLNLECTFDQTMIYGINRKYCTKSV